MSRQEKLREDIASLLHWQLDGDMDDSDDSGDRTILPPDWCNDDNCAEYNSKCRYCVGDQILKLIEGE